MLGPALAPLAIVAPPHLMLSDHESNDDKLTPHFYFQQHTVQIIQLVEGQPPSPRRITSILSSSTSGTPSSSSSPYSSSDADSSQSDDESDPICSSYCSSDVPPHEPPSEHDRYHVALPDETYSVRMKRIFAWRDHFSTGFGSFGNRLSRFSSVPCHHSHRPTDAPPHTPAFKRKLNNEALEEDAVRFFYIPRTGFRVFLPTTVGRCPLRNGLVLTPRESPQAPSPPTHVPHAMPPFPLGTPSDDTPN